MRFADGIFSTRKGNVIKLEELLNKAVEKAREIIEEKNPNLTEEEKNKIAEVIGVGSVKYADLSQNRISHIIFDWDKMLSFEGNTAPYLLYTYARIQSLKRKAKENGYTLEDTKLVINEKLERKLGLLLTQLPIIVLRAAEDYKPNLIADYLFELAQAYNSFYNNLPVLKESEDILKSRLLLSHLAGEVLRKGLDLLGINVIDRMWGEEMIYSIVFSLILSGFAAFYLKANMLYMILSIVFGLITAVFSFLSKKYDKLTIVYLFIGVLLSVFGIIRSFDIKLFILLVFVSTIFSSLYNYKSKRLFIALAWITNAIAIGSYIYINISTTSAIIIAILIFASGLRDIFPKKHIEEDAVEKDNI